MQMKIASTEDKTTATGKSYQLVKDSLNNCYSVWNFKLEAGHNYDVDIKEKNGYKQITAAREQDVKAECNDLQRKERMEATPATVPASVTANSEPKFRINIKQMATGKHNWEVTTRADSIDEIKAQLEAVTTLAREQCEKLNPPTTEMVAGLKGVQ